MRDAALDEALATPPSIRPAKNPLRRAVIALVALYALALQSVLGGMLVAAAATPEHALCRSEAGPPGAAPADKHLPAHGHLACCAAAQIAMPAAITTPEPTGIGTPPRAAATITRPPVFATAPRAPPGAGPSPRGPPVA